MKKGMETDEYVAVCENRRIRASPNKKCVHKIRIDAGAITSCR